MGWQSVVERQHADRHATRAAVAAWMLFRRKLLLTSGRNPCCPGLGRTFCDVTPGLQRLLQPNPHHLGQPRAGSRLNIVVRHAPTQRDIHSHTAFIQWPAPMPVVTEPEVDPGDDFDDDDLDAVAAQCGGAGGGGAAGTAVGGMAAAAAVTPHAKAGLASGCAVLGGAMHAPCCEDDAVDAAEPGGPPAGQELAVAGLTVAGVCHHVARGMQHPVVCCFVVAGQSTKYTHGHARTRPRTRTLRPRCLSSSTAHTYMP